jgi:hypothetical protein
MPTKKIVWVADCLRTKNKHEFSSKKAAIEFEKKEAIEKEIEDGLPLVEKYFKTQFSNDCCTWSDQCRTFCVGCGKLISQYEEESDGYDRTYAGKNIYSEPHDLFLDGFRCIPCHNKILKLYEKMVQLCFKNNKKVILMSFDSLEHWKDMRISQKLEMVRTVKCWHNRNRNKKNKNNRNGAKKCQKTKTNGFKK